MCLCLGSMRGVEVTLNFKALLAEGCQLHPTSLHCTERTHTSQASPVCRCQGRDEARCMLAPACLLFSGSAHGATVPLSQIFPVLLQTSQCVPLGENSQSVHFVLVCRRLTRV